MDISIIAQIVKENPRLILPDLGAFLVKDGESGFSTEKVSFSPYLRYNDGKLEQEVAKKLGISLSEAKTQVSQMVAQIKSSLASSQKFAIPGLGTLIEETAGMPTFKPAAGGESTDKVAGAAASATAGATSAAEQAKGTTGKAAQGTAAQKAKQQAQQRAARQAAAAGKSTTPKKKKKGSNAPKVILIIAIIVGVFFLVDFLWLGWLIPKRSGDETPNTELVRARQQQEKDSIDRAMQMARAAEEDSIRQAEEEAEMRQEAEAEKQSVADNRNPMRRANPNRVATNAYTGPDHYHVVVGSFEQAANADAFAEKLSAEGYETYILERPSGMTAVIVGSYRTFREANTALNQVLQHLNSAWILYQ